MEFKTEDMAEEIGRSYDENGFTDWAVENLHDRMREAGISQAERNSRIMEARDIAMASR